MKNDLNAKYPDPHGPDLGPVEGAKRMIAADKAEDAVKAANEAKETTDSARHARCARTYNRRRLIIVTDKNPAAPAMPHKRQIW
jgi:hypothetical protein